VLGKEQLLGHKKLIQVISFQRTKQEHLQNNRIMQKQVFNSLKILIIFE